MIVLAALVLGLRHLVMAASLAPYLDHVSRPMRALIAFGLTDEIFALTESQFRDIRADVSYMAGLMTALCPAWIISGFLGAWFGALLPDPRHLGLDFAFPAAFTALLIPTLRSSPARMAAIVGAVIGVSANHVLPGTAHLLAAGLIGALVGTVVERRQRETAKWS